jgi:hypothetical protein
MLRRVARWITCFRPAGLLLLAVLALGMGCQWHAMPGPGGCLTCPPATMDVGCDQCGGSCDGACGARVEADCDAPCQQFPGTCGTFIPGGCGGLSGLMLPLLSNHLACGSGCGDAYWGEWMFDPPDCCDSCGDGCWSGPAGNAPYCGEYGGCLQGLLAGPVAVIRGTQLGVTGLLSGACATVRCGYGQAVGYGDACGCADCTGMATAPACESCGASSCDGGCAQVPSPVARSLAAARPLGTGVPADRTVSPVTHHRSSTKPPHRVVMKRLRR